MGCAALVGLGQTREVDGGAVPLDVPRLPDPLPRWDDVCVAVVGLARQQHLLAFRRRDGTPAPRRGGFVIVQRDAPPPAPPNVAAAHGLGPALADPPRNPRIVAHLDLLSPPEPGALRTLERLGLVAGGAWTTAAEPVMWRVGVTDWALAVEDDPRLSGAVDHAVETLPEAIRSEIAAPGPGLGRCPTPPVCESPWKAHAATRSTGCSIASGDIPTAGFRRRKRRGPCRSSTTPWPGSCAGRSSRVFIPTALRWPRPERRAVLSWPA